MRATLILIAAFALGGCLGTSPEEARANALGVDYDDGDETHAPGMPCLYCHGPDHTPGEEQFALAGTVFLYASDRNEDGLGGVTVHLRDARGREMHAISNRAGNFMFEVDGGEGRVRVDDEEGKTELGFEPEYPIEAWIEQGGVEQRMRTPIRREGSCAHCHFGDPSADSVGRVFLMEGDG